MRTNSHPIFIKLIRGPLLATHPNRDKQEAPCEWSRPLDGRLDFFNIKLLILWAMDEGIRDMGLL